MGEAKRRKSQQADFRGLVVTTVRQQDNGYFRVGGLDAQELRHALFLWDKVAWPNSNLVRVDSGPDEAFLESIGFMIRPDLRLTLAGYFDRLIDVVHLKAFEELERKNPGSWTLGQGLSSLIQNEGLLVPNQGILLQLNGAVPVPDKDVPLAEVLEFKARRQDELRILRAEIERLHDAVNAAEDSVDALNRCIAEIDTACSNVIRVSSEWQFPVRLTNVKNSFEFRPLATLSGAVSAYLAAEAKLLPVSSSALAAIGGAVIAMAPAIKLSADFGWRGLKPRPNPYRYVYSYHREIF